MSVDAFDASRLTDATVRSVSPETGWREVDASWVGAPAVRRVTTAATTVAESGSMVVAASSEGLVRL